MLGGPLLLPLFSFSFLPFPLLPFPLLLSTFHILPSPFSLLLPPFSLLPFSLLPFSLLPSTTSLLPPVLCPLCQKPCWDQARLSSLVNKQVALCGATYTAPAVAVVTLMTFMPPVMLFCHVCGYCTLCAVAVATLMTTLPSVMQWYHVCGYCTLCGATDTAPAVARTQGLLATTAPRTVDHLVPQLLQVLHVLLVHHITVQYS